MAYIKPIVYVTAAYACSRFHGNLRSYYFVFQLVDQLTISDRCLRRGSKCVKTILFYRQCKAGAETSSTRWAVALERTWIERPSIASKKHASARAPVPTSIDAGERTKKHLQDNRLVVDDVLVAYQRLYYQCVFFRVFYQLDDSLILLVTISWLLLFGSST